MPNIFRSKEVYKKISREIHNGNSMVPVRGVYVSGEYRPPYYNEGLVRISDVKSKPAKVVNFTQATITPPDDHVLNIINITMDTLCPSIVKYTQSTMTNGDDHVLNIINITMDAKLSSIISYTQTTVTNGDDHVLNILDIGMDSSLSYITRYQTKECESTPEPMLRISGLNTSKADITNIRYERSE